MNPDMRLAPVTPSHETPPPETQTTSALVKPALVQFVTPEPEHTSTSALSGFANPVFGVDYIVDYYAILDVARDSDKDAIRRAYHLASQGCHPDVLARANEQIRSAGERQFKLLGQAYEVLYDNERRAVYDALLASFPTELISTNGNAIINLNSRRVVADILASGADLDEPDREKFIAGHCNFNPAVFDLVEAQVKAAGDSAPAALRALFRDQLIVKLTFLTLAEETAWRKAGVLNQGDPKVFACGEDLVAAREEQIEAFPSELTEITRRRLLAAGSGAPPLLLAGAAPPDVDPRSLASVTEIALAQVLERFEGHKETLLAAARKRAQAFDQLISLTECRYVPEPAPSVIQREFVVYLLINDQIASAFMFRFEGQEPIETKNIDFATTLSGQPVSVLTAQNEELRTLNQAGVNTMALAIEANLPIETQIGVAISKHLELLTGETSIVQLRRADQN